MMNRSFMRGETNVPPLRDAAAQHEMPRMSQLRLRGDINRNGVIDNDREARTNTEYNSVDIQKLQNELRNLKKRLTVSTIATNNQIKDNSTFASTAKIAEEISDGVQRVYFNNLGKSVVFKNGNKPMSECIQIGTKDNLIKNVNEIKFTDESIIKGVVNSADGLEEEDLEQYVPSMKLMDGIGKSHTHITEQISREYFEEEQYQEEEDYEEEEEYQEEEDGETITKTRLVEKKRMVDKTRIVNKFTPLNEILDTKSNVGHTHYTNDISRRYEEEEEVEEEENGEMTTITKTVIKYKPLEDILEGKADVSHNHDLRYSNINHNHDDRYSSINHNHDSSYSNINHNHDNRYSQLNHTHLTTDISRRYEEEEEYEENGETKTRTITKTKPLEEILSSKSDVGHNHDSSYSSINHNHDSSYVALNDVVSEIQERRSEPASQDIAAQTDNTKIPNITAIKSYCSDFITPTSLENDTELQNLIKGDKGDDGLSAFEVWVSQQTPKQVGEYTYQEYLAAITGPQGPQGIQGPKGEDGADGKDGSGRSWWDYLLSYGLTGASAAQSIAGDYATATALEALQTEVTVIAAQVAALTGGAAADAFTSAVEEAAQSALSLSDYVGGDFFGSIKNVFTNLAGKLRTARSMTNSFRDTLGVAWDGYLPLNDLSGI